MSNQRWLQSGLALALLLTAGAGLFPVSAWSQTVGRERGTRPAPRPAPTASAESSEQGGAPRLLRMESKSYHVYHNLTANEAKMFAGHMDAVFDEYSARFSRLSGVKPRPMPLYLFRKQADYEAFLTGLGIQSANTGGMFFVTRKEEGLATFVSDRPITQTFSVLQHEGFHQFAFYYIGPHLPVWVNEGLAQYFEDGVLVGTKLYLGLANATRIAAVKQAVEKKQDLDFDDLINMSNEQWAKNVAAGSPQAALQYDQSWSIAFFLIAGEGGKYRQPFENYLQLVAKNRPSAAAFGEAFGTTDTTAFRRKWVEFARAVQPDAINLAISKLEFLGQGLKYLHQKKAPMPGTVAELRSILQRIQFSTVTTRSGVRTVSSSKDESNYAFESGGSERTPFKLLKPENGKTPPRLTAPGLTPEPTLVWYFDGEGDLVMDIAFR